MKINFYLMNLKFNFCYYLFLGSAEIIYDNVTSNHSWAMLTIWGIIVDMGIIFARYYAFVQGSLEPVFTQFK